MSGIKITYFNVSGRAEPSRLALHIAGIPFNDNRISEAEWPKIKPSTPYLSLPIATIDDQQFAQSNAILRYCGKLAGLYPQDPKQALFADEIIDMLEDAVLPLFSYKGADKELLRKARDEAKDVVFPRFFGGLEKRLGTFGDGPFAVGGKLSIADLSIYATFEYISSKRLEFLDKNCIEGYAKMMNIVQAVSKLPKVVEWNKAHE